MGAWIADTLHDRRRKAGRALVLGLTFKENVPDLRNSRSFDLVKRLQWLGHEVEVADPIASPKRSNATMASSSPSRMAGPTTWSSARSRIATIASFPTIASPRWWRQAGRWPTSRACGATAHLDPAIDRWTL